MTSSWKTAPLRLSLSQTDVHVWKAALDLPGDSIRKLRHTLSDKERTRAKRFHFDRDKTRFIATHGILRSILGLYLEVKPSDVNFCYGKFGKPSLSYKFSGTSLCFNISHSHGMALYALTRTRQIGVDIEKIRRFAEMGDIARHFFSPTENEALNRIPEPKKVTAFFNYWTRKEAFIKAIGDGLSYPLDSFDVSVNPDEPAELREIRGNSRKSGAWSIQGLNPARGFAAAFAVRGRGLRLRCWNWSN